MAGADTPESDPRPGEVTLALPNAVDAGLYFIGVIRTPWLERRDCPKQGAWDGPLCRIEVFEPWRAALAGIERYPQIQVLYWMHRARRDLAIQVPRGAAPAGSFALRSPVRPNPIASSIVTLLDCVDGVLQVTRLDCLDGTPLLDLKPMRPGQGPV
jgi:tRNA-Thr(GGU) m(6)t(6)A37 methyltransferase TsaA